MFKLPSVSHHSKQSITYFTIRVRTWGASVLTISLTLRWQAEMIKVRSISVCVLSHVWLCDPMDCSLPGSSVHGVFQKEYWRGCHFLLQGIFLIKPMSPALAGGFFTTEPPGKSQSIFTSLFKKKKKSGSSNLNLYWNQTYLCALKVHWGFGHRFPFQSKIKSEFSCWTAQTHLLAWLLHWPQVSPNRTRGTHPFHMRYEPQTAPKRAGPPECVLGKSPSPLPFSLGWNVLTE